MKIKSYITAQTKHYKSIIKGGCNDIKNNQ
jgi:hypothetical protein